VPGFFAVGPAHDEFGSVEVVVDAVNGAMVGTAVDSGLYAVPRELRKVHEFGSS
jgi:hypothetical protein